MLQALRTEFRLASIATKEDGIIRDLHDPPRAPPPCRSDVQYREYVIAYMYLRNAAMALYFSPHYHRPLSLMPIAHLLAPSQWCNHGPSPRPPPVA